MMMINSEHVESISKSSGAKLDPKNNGDIRFARRNAEGFRNSNHDIVAGNKFGGGWFDFVFMQKLVRWNRNFDKRLEDTDISGHSIDISSVAKAFGRNRGVAGDFQKATTSPTASGSIRTKVTRNTQSAYGTYTDNDRARVNKIMPIFILEPQMAFKSNFQFAQTGQDVQIFLEATEPIDFYLMKPDDAELMLNSATPSSRTISSAIAHFGIRKINNQIFHLNFVSKNEMYPNGEWSLFIGNKVDKPVAVFCEVKKAENPPIP
jgi:hypothetical protein